MEDRHIYSTSFWDKLQDRFNDFKKEIQNIIQDLKPKPRQPKPPSIATKEKTPEKPQVPISIKTPQTITSRTKPKIKRFKKRKTKPIHFRKIADESVQKILVFSLVSTIVVIFGLGVFLTYKDQLHPEITSNKPRQTLTSPTPDETSSWEVYVSDQYRFKFKYPPHYELQEANLGNGDFKVYLIMNPVEQTARGITVMKNKSLLDVVNDIKTNHYQTEQILEEKTINIDNNEAKLFVINAIKGPTRTEVALVEKYGNVYRFDWLNQQILSTFKFIDSGCVDSDSFCEGKPNGTSCNLGVWCDKEGKVCGGQSCVGIGLGECVDNKCIRKNK